jgi:hypothetical protein
MIKEGRGVMTGPEHYNEAERLIGLVQCKPYPGSAPVLQPGEHADVLALAQVHATLTLAAEAWET